MHPGPFQAVLFYFPELSHESPTKPRPEPQTLSPSKGTEDGSGGEVEEY